MHNRALAGGHTARSLPPDCPYPCSVPASAGDDKTWQLDDWHWDPFEVEAQPKGVPSIGSCHALKRPRLAGSGEGDAGTHSLPSILQPPPLSAAAVPAALVAAAPALAQPQALHACCYQFHVAMPGAQQAAPLQQPAGFMQLLECGQAPAVAAAAMPGAAAPVHMLQQPVWHMGGGCSSMPAQHIPHQLHAHGCNAHMGVAPLLLASGALLPFAPQLAPMGAACPDSLAAATPSPDCASTRLAALSSTSGAAAAGAAPDAASVGGADAAPLPGGEDPADKMVCQVAGCCKDLSALKDYHQRYRICDVHIRLPQVGHASLGPSRVAQQQSGRSCAAVEGASGVHLLTHAAHPPPPLHTHTHAHTPRRSCARLALPCCRRC